MSPKIGFWFVQYTPVTWTSQSHHQLSFFHKGIPWYKFQLRYQGCGVHTPLYAYYIEKGVGWKLWYCFESLALRYSPENLPHFLKISTYFTWWHRYFCLCIRRVTEVLKQLSNICKIFVADFFNKSDGSEIFLFLLKHAFKTKTLHLPVWIN